MNGREQVVFTNKVKYVWPTEAQEVWEGLPGLSVGSIPTRIKSVRLNDETIMYLQFSETLHENDRIRRRNIAI